MFEIEFLKQEKILRWRLTGFWTEAIALEFKAALAREMAKARRTSQRFTSVSDSREFPVQSEGVMKILSEMSRDSLAEGSRKLAILVSSSLNHLQAQRSFPTDRIRIFRDDAEAVAWLTEPEIRKDRAAAAA